MNDQDLEVATLLRRARSALSPSVEDAKRVRGALSKDHEARRDPAHDGWIPVLCESSPRSAACTRCLRTQ